MKRLKERALFSHEQMQQRGWKVGDALFPHNGATHFATVSKVKEYPAECVCPTCTCPSMWAVEVEIEPDAALTWVMSQEAVSGLETKEQRARRKARKEAK